MRRKAKNAGARLWAQLGLCCAVVAVGGASRAESTKTATVHPPPEPTTGAHVGLTIGLDFGGEPLYTVGFTDGSEVTVNAGDGVSILFDANWTPLWSKAQRWGVGFGVNAGYKTAGPVVENAALVYDRFPLAASLSGLLRVGTRTHLFLGVGPHAELFPKIRGSGDASGIRLELDNALGAMAEAGVYYEKPPWMLDVGLRRTWLTQSARGLDIDADSVGFFFSVGLLLGPR